MNDRLADVVKHVEANAPMPPEPRVVPKITALHAANSYTYRDRKKLADLPADWRERIFKLAKEGHGPTRFMASLGILRSVFESLIRNEPEFREAIDWAAILCRDWWETQGRDMACGEAIGNATVWYHNMVNRFAWRNTPVEVIVERDAPIPVADLSPEEATAHYRQWIAGSRAKIGQLA